MSDLITLLQENQKLLNKILESEKDKELKSNFIRQYYNFYSHTVEHTDQGCIEKLSKKYKTGNEKIVTTKYIDDKKFINTVETIDGETKTDDRFVNCTGDEFMEEWENN